MYPEDDFMGGYAHDGIDGIGGIEEEYGLEEFAQDGGYNAVDGGGYAVRDYLQGEYDDEIDRYFYGDEY